MGLGPGRHRRLNLREAESGDKIRLHVSAEDKSDPDAQTIVFVTFRSRDNDRYFAELQFQTDAESRRIIMPIQELCINNEMQYIERSKERTLILKNAIEVLAPKSES